MSISLSIHSSVNPFFHQIESETNVPYLLFLFYLNNCINIIYFYLIFICRYSNEGPPSASLLQEWLQDIDNLDPQGLEALQHEMEFGSPDMFFRDLDKL